MLTVFNRRELITLSSSEKLYRVKASLSTAGIASAVKIRGGARAAERARHGIGGVRPDAMYDYTIYVHRDDYQRASAAMQTALRTN